MIRRRAKCTRKRLPAVCIVAVFICLTISTVSGLDEDTAPPADTDAGYAALSSTSTVPTESETVPQLASDLNSSADRDTLETETTVTLIPDEQTAAVRLFQSEPGFLLPATGAMGARLYTIAGASIMLAAGLLYRKNCHGKGKNIETHKLP